METEVKTKRCEVCNTEIPSDYVNLLCLNCYIKQAAEADMRRQEELETAKLVPNAPTNSEAVKPVDPLSPREAGGSSEPASVPLSTTAPSGGRFGILDPAYQTNPEMEDKEQVFANLAQFVGSGKMLWYQQRNLYTFIKNYCMTKVTKHVQYPKQIWRPKIVDVGCGSGVGSNVLSQEADFVWGIDKNERSIKFAKECFTREKNGIYYSSQLTFDHVDIMTDTRDFLQFEVVVAIEIIEHIEDTDGFLRAIIRFAKRDKKGNYAIGDPTEFFISCPNRNNEKIRKDRPQNVFHVREYTAQEYTQLLQKYFRHVELLDQKGNPVSSDTAETPMLAKCSIPIT